MKLNENQKTAVEHLEGPMLVIAGPGSGKTTVIVKRAHNLVLKYGVNPENILVITFTKAAAKNMKERYLSLCNDLGSGITFCTLHSLFFRILRTFSNFTVDNLISESLQFECIDNIIKRFKLEIENKTDFIKQSLLLISGIKTGAIKKEELKNAEYSKYSTLIYEEYQSYLKSERLLDFDDLMLYCYRLLLSNEESISYCRNKFKYILVDEFQDICTLQYKIIRLLAHPLNNVFAVGDDDQSIYSFRGANPSIMLNFERDFKNAGLITLDTNYRSGGLIVKLSNKLIEHNKERYDKSISAGNLSKSYAKIVKVDNQNSQNRYIIDKIKNMIKDGYNYDDFAILARTNKETESLISELIRNNIAFSSRERASNIFNGLVALDILAYFHLAYSYKINKTVERSHLIRVMNKPLRYIKREWLKAATVDLAELKRSVMLKEWVFYNIASLIDSLRELSLLKPASAIEYILNVINYREYLIKHSKENNLSFDELYEQALELKELFDKFSTFEEIFLFVDDYTKKLAEIKDDFNSKNSVTISTFHSAKGLEFKNVFIVNCIDGNIPYSKNKPSIGKIKLNKKTLEEERRLFYVSLTRAIDSLFLIVPKSVHSRDKIPSGFLDELR